MSEVHDLRKRGELLTSAFESAPFFVAITQGPNHVFVMANSAFRRLIDDQGLVGRPIADVLPEVSQGGVLDQVYQSGEPFEAHEVAVRLRRESGDTVERCINFVIQPLFDSSDQVSGIQIHGTDVSEQVRARAELAEKEQRFRTVLESALDAAYRRDLQEDHYDYMSPVIEELIGFTPQEMEAMPQDEVLERIHPDDYDHVINSIERGVETGKGIVEYRFRAKDGRYHWLADHFTVSRDEAGRPHYRSGVVRDITTRRRLEEERERERALIETMLDALPVGVVVADAEGRVVRDNAAARELWGLPLEADSLEDYGRFKGWWPETGERIEADEWAMARALREGEEVRGELVQNQQFDSEEKRCYLNNVAPIYDAEGHILGAVAAMLDVTDRLAAEQALRESEERFRNLADNIAQLAWMADPDGWIFWYNKRWFEYTGTTFEEMQGWGWQAVHHPEHVDRVVEKIKECFENGVPWEDTFPLRGADGTYRWFLSRALPIRDESGTVVRWFGTNTDVTERLELEHRLAELNETLEERVRERTQQVRELASSLTMAEQEERRRISQVLHDDLQQQLYAIAMKLRFVRRAIDEDNDGEAVEHVNIAEEWVDESVELTRNLTVDLSPPVMGSEGLVDALEWLAVRMHELHGLLVELEAEHRFRTPDADVRVLLFQIVQELLFNVSKHAEADRATVVVREAGEDRVQISVVDEGKGFAVGDHEERGQGGFGLFSVRERLSLLGGRLEIDASPGEGTCVKLEVPLRLRRPEAPSP